MNKGNFSGRPQYDNRNIEISDEITPDPFSEEPQPIKVRVSRSEVRTTIGKRAKLKSNENNEITR